MNAPAGQRWVAYSEKQDNLGAFDRICFMHVGALVIGFRARVCTSDLRLEYVSKN